MTKLGIIAADAARARFITAEVLEDPDIEGSPRMTEHAELANPLGEMPPREAFSDRMSRKPSGAGPQGAGPASDDHRDRHELEEERRFVQRIIDATQKFVSEQRPTRLVFASGPRLLGMLRAQIGSRRWDGLDTVELSEDFSPHSVPKIRELLTKRGLLPQPRLPRAGVFRPRGQAPQG